MRYCFGEKPQVYEASGNNFAELLRDVADEVDKMDANWFNITSGMGSDGNLYSVIVYVH